MVGAICTPNTLLLPIGTPLCDEGLLGVTNLRPEQGPWSIICSEALNGDPQDFPGTREERLADFAGEQWPENYIDYYTSSRVAIMLHEMHHALVPRSWSPTLWNDS